MVRWIWQDALNLISLEQLTWEFIKIYRLLSHLCQRLCVYQRFNPVRMASRIFDEK